MQYDLQYTDQFVTRATVLAVLLSFGVISVFSAIAYLAGIATIEYAILKWLFWCGVIALGLPIFLYRSLRCTSLQVNDSEIVMKSLASKQIYKLDTLEAALVGNDATGKIALIRLTIEGQKLWLFGWDNMDQLASVILCNLPQEKLQIIPARKLMLRIGFMMALAIALMIAIFVGGSLLLKENGAWVYLLALIGAMIQLYVAILENRNREKFSIWPYTYVVWWLVIGIGCYVMMNFERLL